MLPEGVLLMKKCSDCIGYTPLRQYDGSLGRCDIDNRIVNEDEAEHCINYEEEEE
jgi:hypothetical protein